MSPQISSIYSPSPALLQTLQYEGLEVSSPVYASGQLSSVFMEPA